MDRTLSIERERPQTEKEWFGAIEELRQLIMPHLGTMKLIELGNIKCVPDMDQGSPGEKSINWGSPKVIPSSNVDLETLGLFFPQFSFNGIRYPQMNKGMDRHGEIERGLIKVWGLTDFGWILATVQYQYWDMHFMCSFAGTAEIVNIYETDLQTIAREVKDSPEWMWLQLARAIEGQSKYVNQKRDYFEPSKEIYGKVTAQIAAFAQGEFAC
jgi:hypothetical protein